MKFQALISNKSLATVAALELDPFINFRNSYNIESIISNIG